MSHAVAEGKGLNTRPFYATIFIITLLAVYSIFIRGPASTTGHDGHLLSKRSGEDCRMVHGAQDKCAFVRANCRDDEAGLIEYLSFYYCTLGTAKPVAFVILLVWLGLLFTTIGIAASDFFSVNLSTIATILGLSESLAGVTFLAFGNGSPDVFSTFAAMSSNSGSMAVGELVGAAGFITSVVAGSMALVREFKVGKKTFVRDICFFIVAVTFTVGFLSDGQVHLWECCVMIGFYVFYVIVVVGWHAFERRRKARNAREAASRGHFYSAGEQQAHDELEPYIDEPDDDPTTGGRRGGPATVDIGILERGPRIEIGTANDDDNDDDDDSDRVQHVAAEMASSMRINRPRGRRNTTTITPIRPSLVGALEFRSVLSSLQEERNMRLNPIHGRSYSHNRIDVGWHEGGGPAVRGYASAQTIQGVGDAALTTRNRAVSSGALPTVLDDDLAGPADKSSEDNDRDRSASAHTRGGMLAPPPSRSTGGRAAEGLGTDAPAQPTPPRLFQLRIPSPGISPPGSERSSPAVSPFPRYTDSPLLLTPDPAQPSHLALPTPGIEESLPFPHVHHEAPKPIRWWPYQLLPAPHVLMSTLFPTLQGWRSKSIWDKLVSLISVPSIFLLVVTLPVVESETTDDDSEGSIVEEPATGQLGNTAAPVSYEPNGSIEPETEWQRYRRSTRSRGSSGHTSPALISLVTPDEPRGAVSTEDVQARLGEMNGQTTKPASDLNSILGSEDQGWNRWLLILQIFTGPLFAVFIVWANMAEDLDQPGRILVRAALISLVCSLVMLGVLLLTTLPDHRPKFHFLFCFLGFVIAIAWISSIAGEVVGVLKAFGVILDISEAILGLTIFAVGNSVGDLVADVTVARLGYPVMALSACFGGPMLNILLGIGLGGAYQIIQTANRKHSKHPDRPLQYKPYHIQVGGTLMVSAVVLLITLLVLLIVLPMSKWMMTRKIGFGLIALWAVGTTVNLVIEITGVWRDVA
ncbi:Sodium/calcium exchanger protein-domain-containing protein [Xylariales sp. AK1849]|nr:Sodium/calcium exchanger protein-domain-containing protein [Xylariales sp. AK1849]